MTVAATPTGEQHRAHRAVGGVGADAPGVVATAALVVVTFESWRLLFPHVYGLKERASLTVTAIVALVAGAAGVAAPLVRRLTGGRAVAAALAALGLWRVGCLMADPLPVAGAVLGAALAAVAVASTLAAPAPGARRGVLAGLAIDLVLVASFASWDPIWQRTPAAWAVGVALAAALVAGGWRLRSTGHDASRPIGGAGGVALGAVAMLELLFLANPSFLAGAGLTHPVAVLVAAFGLLALAAGARLYEISGRPVVPIAAVVLAACGYAVATASASEAWPLVLTAQVAAGAIAAAALAPKASARTAGAELGLAAGMVVPVVGTLLFQLHYDAPLPFDNRYLVAGAGLAGALAARGRPDTPPAAAWRPRRRTTLAPLAAVALGAAAIAVPLALHATEPDRAGPAAAGVTSLRVVQWNVHQAVSEDGTLDPGAVAQAIEAQGPVDVVVLNEVGRGWPLSGQLDLATWLSRRLDMRFAWAGAASDQFGNLVLSRLPMATSDVMTLPVVDGMQGRSALHVTIGVGSRSLDVVATHLQHHNDAVSVSVRLAEVRALVARWAGRDVILAGDLNPRQGDPPAYPERRPATFEEIGLLLDAGFTTAADLSACAAPTSNRNCSDYVFVAGALRASSYTVVPTTTGDHRMIVTDVALR